MNDLSEHKKILAIALEGERKMQAFAIYKDEHLTMLEMRDISGNPDEWLDAMREDIAEKTRNGWAVMVEDRTSSFPGEAVSFNFDAPCEDGRTYLQCVLDWYFSMQSRGQIHLEQSMERFTMRIGAEGSLMDAKRDEKGRIVYRVNWMEFNAGHKALLMCVAGAVMEEPLSERWIRAMAGGRNRARTQVPNPLGAFVAAMNRADTSAQRRLELHHEHAEIQKAHRRKLYD